MKKIIFKNREEFKWNGRTYDFYGKIEVLGYDTESAEFTRGF